MRTMVRVGMGMGMLLLSACSSEVRGGVDGGAGEGNDVPDELAAALPPGAFDVKASLRVEQPEELGADFYARKGCLAFDFTGRFQARKDDWSFEAAVRGELASTVLARGTKTHAARIASDEANERDNVLAIPAGACCERLYFSELEVVRDGDGFHATGKGRLANDACGGDVLYEEAVSIDLVGTPDATAPTLALPGAAIHPLEHTVVMADEALALDATAEFEREPGRWRPVHAPASAPQDASALWSFEVPPLLRFGVSSGWRAQGSDWAGNALVSQGTLRTWAEPGFLAQDGFEGEVPAAGTKPRFGSEALAGTRSLLIAEEDAVTFHLETNGGSSVVFDARSLARRDEVFGQDTETHLVRYRVGVEDGLYVTSGELSLAFDGAGDDAAPKQEVVRVPLLEAGDAVIVSFDIESFDDDGDCGLIDCVGVPALIDDLRVE